MPPVLLRRIDALVPRVESPAQFFANYTRVPQRLPSSFWMVLRLTVLALTLAEIILLLADPTLGLRLFWGIAVPALPALFAISPGLWRQLCPMAFVNQLPRTFGRGRALALSPRLRFWSYMSAIALLIIFVSLRSPVLNQSGPAVAMLCSASLVLAFVGGMVFKGRGGWCGTFCPLGPVQRSHGQAPLLMVSNGYCNNCVGCQKNCFDFNPRAAIFEDLADDDLRHSTQRMIFMSLLPGLIWGYYNLSGQLTLGYGHYMLELAASMLFASGLFFLLRGLLNISAYRLATAFGVTALLIYYYFAGPILINTVGALSGFAAPAWLVTLSRYVAIPIALAVLYNALRGEHAYHALQTAETQMRVDSAKVQVARGHKAVGAEITERSSGKTFSAQPGQTLLEAMEVAGVPIDFGCRSGICGADPVGIVEGHANLDAAGEEELATLRRLGLEGRARLACVCRAAGAVTIDRDARSVPASEPARAATTDIDRAAQAGIGSVLIIGNGVAGITVAESLRRESPTLRITVVAEEAHHFYNRMAIGRVIYNQSSMEGMYLLPESWYKENRVEVWLNTVAAAIDRSAKTVRLGTGEKLTYDRLVLATGARAALPAPDFLDHGNAFVLRNAVDAQSIRAAIQRFGAKKAIVIGGGVLGVEAAEALTHLGLRVTLLHRGKRLMDRQLDAEGAQLLGSYLAHQGIEVLTECRVAGFDADARLRAVRLEDGQALAADLFLACTGIVPNVDLARDAGIDVGRGIRVDACMRSSDSDIFAVGDAAEGESTAAGLWQTAVDQARAASAAILGGAPVESRSRIVLQLKSEGIDLRSYGVLEAEPDCEVLTANRSDALWWRLLLRAGKVVGAVFVGPPGSSRDLTQLLKSGAEFEPYLPALRRGELALAQSTGVSQY